MFRDLSVSELQEIVTPERASMYESMLAALQRMKDKGISDVLFDVGNSEDFICR